MPDNGGKKRASLYTLGCRLNQAETALIAEQLQAAGYALVPFDEPADLGIVNTCTVTHEADVKSRKAIKSFIRRNPHAFTAVIGCYSQLGYKALATIEGVDLIVGNQEKLNVLDYVVHGKTGTPLIVRDRLDRDEFTIETSGEGALTKRTNLKIQDGCDFMCSFCVIPFARGRARSRDFQDLITEARRLAGRGVKEIVLTGINVGTYFHLGRTIVDVVEALSTIPGIARIRISSIEPTTVPKALLDLMADPSSPLVPHLHIPVQSGSNQMLERMKRRYTREQFCDFVERATGRVPNLCVGTDILVGAPGETETDFTQTLDLLENSPIAYAHVFKYSDRKNTAASRMPDKVDPRTQTARSVAVRRLSARKRAAFLHRYLGRTLEVLFEEEEGGYWWGYTGNYIRVAARCNGKRGRDSLENTLKPVQLQEVCGDFMVGTAI